jgi:hypothetical protein
MWQVKTEVSKAFFLSYVDSCDSQQAGPDQGMEIRATAMPGLPTKVEAFEWLRYIIFFSKIEDKLHKNKSFSPFLAVRPYLSYFSAAIAPRKLKFYYSPKFK